MKRGHVPLRTCVVCRRRAPKTELDRWLFQEGRLAHDERQQAPGFGHYCCRDGACRERIGIKLGKRKKLTSRKAKAPTSRC
ncbi:MAG: DUF448 domain-containing protein [Desulfobulbus sp.]|nr:MAG: DUF448 domain-containing protein [Desulfobulbus sp.]